MNDDRSCGRRGRAKLQGETAGSNFRLRLKRTFDVLAAVIGLVVLAPLILAVSVAIKINSRGPVFVREPMYGYKRREIQVLKFRSTIALAEADGINSRVTGVGQVLRRTGIDGIPQLVNVLRGDMSIVGPRPYTSPQYLFDSGIEAMLGDVKPGLTGAEHITEYRDGLVPPEQRINDDLRYAKNWSLARDIEIILERLSS
jgi:lipopolysaccharide/colanic/teichoic acid biosynthesis glycosyltransferase